MLKHLKRAGNWVSNYSGSISKSEPSERLTMCSKCYSFYYRNSWHFEKPSLLNREHDEVFVRFTECPPCLEQELAFYETESGFVMS